MIENAMLIGNHQDSSFNNVMDYCQSCGKEIYFGEEYRDMDGDSIHDEIDCITTYVKSHSTKKIAGE
ncbi:hypothetical protein CN271_26275 [Bacillus cereus]|nr:MULTISPECIES: hypothetical protein [Bacillus cereus group]PEE32392.1 hypothetical protein CON59_31385 [Bacillus cereus]PEK67231.1 hypothetical protein CN594_35455 [Bacillus toyonensis]PEL21385.1 hypothetical protein CN624_26075 [Bacillus toyonensis]PET34914.1 hypothetical protein CN523_31120 [Bacillus cereus]PEV72621.1 hypothetical protein CN429_28820 [Bacillus cereus]